MTRLYSWHDLLICVTWLIHISDMTHSCQWHDSFIFVTHLCDMTHSYKWHDSFINIRRYSFICWTCIISIYATWHICDLYEWVMSHRWVSHVTYINVSCHLHHLHICDTYLLDMHHFHICDMTQLHSWHDLLIPVTWLIHLLEMQHSHICDLTHSYVWHDASIYTTWLVHILDMHHSHIWDMTHSCEWHD